MYEMCRVNREEYESDNEIYDQNRKKMTDTLNEVEFVRLTAEQHFMETTQDLECWPHQGPACTMSKRLLKEKEFKNVVVRMSQYKNYQEYGTPQEQDRSRDYHD